MGAFWQIGRTSSHSAFLLDRRNIFARSAAHEERERERETDREETNVLHRQSQGFTRSYNFGLVINSRHNGTVFY